MAKKIYVPEAELFNENTLEFTSVKPQIIAIEHSLVSISKWESKWKKSFLLSMNKGLITAEEYLDYIRCMTITQNVDPNTYNVLTEQNLKDISDYMNDPMTATTFSQDPGGRNRDIITAEVIYYWMTIQNIPFDPCQKWHINRLMALIQVCAIKNGDPKKMSKNKILEQNRDLNEIRKKQLGTKG